MIVFKHKDSTMKITKQGKTMNALHVQWTEGKKKNTTYILITQRIKNKIFLENKQLTAN